MESDKMDCLFCKIINGEIPSYTIYEDEIVKVFLDINPNTNGHCLIIPKKHIVTIDEVDDELMLHILKVTKEMHKLLKDKLNIEGLTICQNNNLGQEVKHLHFHLIPRYKHKDIIVTPNKEDIKNVEDIFNKIKNN